MRRRGPTRIAVAATAALGLAAGCLGLGPDALGPRELEALRDAPPSAGGAELHWPLPPERAEQLLRGPGIELRSAKPTAQGLAGAWKVRVTLPGVDGEVAFKWKAAPPARFDGWNNSPRREIAAYELQKWFLDPPDYVVPTTAGYCFPLETYALIEEGAEPSFPGGSCVFGTLSLWLEHVRGADPLYDAARFRADPEYARRVADLNVLTYLIRHRDTDSRNVLESDDPRSQRRFSVDNGIAFGWVLYNFLHLHWDEIRVPALRRSSLERLRGVGPEEILRLAVVAEFALDDAGVLRPVAPGPRYEADRPVATPGGGVQLGLKQEELEKLKERLLKLLVRVDRGEIPLF